VTALLASVRTPEEALIALAGGCDIIDLKEPARGALGRLAEPVIREILGTVARRLPVSATIGDMDLTPGPVAAAVEAMAAAGVDFVKIGIFEGALRPTLAALAPLARSGVRLVAVLLADRGPDPALLDEFAAAGFAGAMLDTADKNAGPLTRHMPLSRLAAFVAEAHRRGLFAGLAGSLGLAEVPGLLPLGPDYLGFRSALTAGRRDGPLDRSAVARLRAAIPLGGARSASSRRATAAAGAQSAARSAATAFAGTSAAKLR
jgi:uncharacterized protein (UPF0264 family)